MYMSDVILLVTICGVVFTFITLGITLFRCYLLAIVRKSEGKLEIGEKSHIRFYFLCLLKNGVYGSCMVFSIGFYMICTVLIMGVIYYCASLFIRHIIGTKDLALWHLIFFAPIVLILSGLSYEWIASCLDKIFKYLDIFTSRFFPEKPWFCDTFLREVSQERV